MTKYLLLALLAMMPITQNLAAQGLENQPPLEMRGRKAYFVCTAFPKGFSNPLLVRVGKNIRKVDLSKRMASEAIKLNKSGKLEIVKLKTNPVEGEDPYHVIGNAQVKQGTKDALIILSSVELKKGVRTYQVKSHDLSEFKGGDYLYINLSPLNVAVQLDHKKIPIKAKSSVIHKARNLNEPTNVPASYAFYNPISKQWNLLSASTIVLSPTRREICVFSWNPKFKRVSYHGITFPVQ